MIRRILVMGLIGLMITVTGASFAFCADIVGTVSDAKGTPIANVQLSAKDSSGKSSNAVLTDSHGKYLIGGLQPGTYTFFLDPRTPGLKGGDAVATVGEKGLTINWKVSADAPALAMATEGSAEELAGDPFGLSAGAFAGVAVGVSGVVAGSVVGGVAAAGGFSSSTPSSPSL